MGVSVRMSAWCGLPVFLLCCGVVLTHPNGQGLTGDLNVIDAGAIQDTCGGSITFTVTGETEDEELIHIETKRIVRIDNVKKVEVQGNCCFFIHSKFRFKGSAEYLTQAHGITTPKSSRIRSIQKVPCVSST